MFIEKTDETRKIIDVSIPLTKGTDKTRIKKRSVLNEYGFPVATRSVPFSQQCYVEWQIGYDVVLDDGEKSKKTTLKNITFTGANGKEKALYELSEYLFYFHKWGVITSGELTNLKNFLNSVRETDFLDSNPNYAIERSHPIPKELLGIEFEYTQVKYPLFIHKFPPFELVTEIKITEKQYAIGVQPMLYFCFPITELKSSKCLLGRVAEPKETAIFEINESNIRVFVETLKLFGILSKNHNSDAISIIDAILTNNQ